MNTPGPRIFKGQGLVYHTIHNINGGRSNSSSNYGMQNQLWVLDRCCCETKLGHHSWTQLYVYYQRDNYRQFFDYKDVVCDPLTYSVLLPHGDVGWYPNSQKVTLMHFYGYSTSIIEVRFALASTPSCGLETCSSSTSWMPIQRCSRTGWTTSLRARNPCWWRSSSDFKTLR